MLAAVIFLGGSVCGNNATTQSPAVFNFTTPVMVRWTEAESVEEQRRDGVTPAATQTKLLSTSSSSSVKEKQPDTTDVSEDREKLKHKEKNDKHDHSTRAEKEELGKKKRIKV